jgi:transcriptional regulator with XRE-family HTH domain
MAPDTAVREFGPELHRWRERRKLSQLELALRAGTTQRHLSFIERGRASPGRDIVVRLTESLDLPLRERNSLLLAAGYAPVYAETDLSAPILEPVRTALQHVLDAHLPYPALIMGRHGVLIAENQGFSILTEGVAPELLAPPVNALRLALHPNGIAARIINLRDWAAHILERRRLELERAPNDEMAALLGELESYVPEQRSDEQPDPSPLGFAVPLRLRSSVGELNLLATRTTFATAVDITLVDLVLEAFLPADDVTSLILNQRASAR